MDNLDKSCFAYPSMKKYPIHTKEAALNSYQEFCTEKEAIPAALVPEIEQNFAKSAAYHEIELKPMEKQAAAPREVLHFVTGSDAILQMTKVACVEDIEEGAKFLITKRASVPRKMLKEGAKYVLWCAANSDMPMDSDPMKKIAQIAGVGVGNRDEIQHEFEKRATLNIYAGKDNEEFWKYANEIKAMSDEEFYKEATLNTICDVLEEIDALYDNQHKYGSVLKRPEEVVFANGMNDLLKEASDLVYIESNDTTISKKALLERKDAVNSFFEAYFGSEKETDDAKIVSKVASLDEKTANALLEAIE